MLKKFFKTIIACPASLLIAVAPLPAQYLEVSADQLLGQTDFDDGVGLPWHTCETLPADLDFEITDGVYRITINNPGGASRGGEDRWDCQFRHRGLAVQQGHTYKVKYTIKASKDCTYYTKIGDMSEPYFEDWHGEPDSSQYNNYWDLKPLKANQAVTVEGSFTATRSSETVEWAFHIGGDSVPEGTVFEFDNMSLTDDQYTAPEKEQEWQRADILTNQLGYFADREKKATLVSDDTNSLDFQLVDSSGNEVYSGKTSPKGYDEDSGDNVHIIDFSDFSDEGTYKLVCGNSESREFQIGSDLYNNMLYDSLKYFYHNRSGIDITMPYCEEQQYARSAGHNPDNVQTEIVNTGSSWDYNDSYSLDVTGGWYDAGDHGKYVVNGGISVWTMQNQYERSLYIDGADNDSMKDGYMNIPESNNGYPDILDEARYEMEFMLKMIVPDGKELAGMVHHKVHDVTWTGLAVAPADDPKERIIKPPTTTATLNISATAAQAYRVWKDLDSEFAEKCLEAAKKTYEAAKAHPDRFAPLDEAVGGGAYGDDNADDEFYWAACELYLATGEQQYYDDMKNSEYFLTMPTKLSGGENVDTVASFDWGSTAGLGTLSLALVKGNLDKKDIEKVTENITDAGDFYLDLEDSQGYGVPIKQSTVNKFIDLQGYPWGSNSMVVNSAIVMAYAYDLSGDGKYYDGVTEAMDYIMGRNPVDYSYVTGYGTHSATYPHHRFFANQVDSNFPLAPAGILVGGPNSGLQDPWVKGSGWKLGEKAPQLCYMDNIESWSTNECTINWNSPLAWVTSFLTKNPVSKSANTVSDSSNSSSNSVSGSSASNSSKNSASESSDSKNKNSSSTTQTNKKNNKNNATQTGEIIKWLAILAIVVSSQVFVFKIIKLFKGDNNNKKEG